MSGGRPRATEKRIARRLRDRVGRGGSAVPGEVGVGSLPPPADAAEPPEELLQLHERYSIADLDFSSRRRWLATLREKLLRPVRELAVRQTELNALNARVLSELWNRTALLETTAVSRDSQQAALGALTRRLNVVQASVEALRRPDDDEIDYAELAGGFRGEEAAVAEHQRRYVDRFAGAAPVLDVGCGRGEFLELLRDAGVEARGVDADPQMVARCRAKGLDVERGEALAYLRRLRPGSLGGIFAAQLIEHMRPPAVIELVRLSHRALRPGGVLLIESVNPRALITISTFFLDFTHERLYDGEAVVRLLEAEGFDQVELDLSLPVGDADRLPELPRDSAEELRQLDDAFRRLNVDLYGDRAYAVTGVR